MCINICLPSSVVASHFSSDILKDQRLIIHHQDSCLQLNIIMLLCCVLQTHFKTDVSIVSHTTWNYGKFVGSPASYLGICWSEHISLPVLSHLGLTVSNLVTDDQVRADSGTPLVRSMLFYVAMGLDWQWLLLGTRSRWWLQ